MTVNPSAEREEIAGFYDGFSERLFRDYINGNPRIDLAIESVCRQIPDRPCRVLDIGCGIGQSAYRYVGSRPLARVTAIDISPQNIATAERFFPHPQIEHAVSNLTDGVVQGEYDVIAMLDVHEHIPRSEWEAVHANLAGWLGESGQLVMTIPSPEHQRDLYDNHPDGLQVVDEVITLADIATIAERLSTTVLEMRYVSAWRGSDYVHVVFARDVGYARKENALDTSLLGRVRRKVGQWRRSRRVQSLRATR
ncbi:MAG: class I SAM-dependent methyltransferase [Planctomycetota bacterium]